MDQNVTLDDAEWSQRERFERIFHDEYKAVLAYAAMRGDLELAKDAAAQTFLVAWRRRDELPDPPRAWLLGVTRHTLADLRRSRSRQDAVRARICDSEALVGEVDETSEIATDREVVATALDRLQESDAELLRLVYWDDLSCRQAAETLGCTVTAVKVRLLRARRRFERSVGQLDEAGQAPRLQSHTSPAPNRSDAVSFFKEA